MELRNQLCACDASVYEHLHVDKHGSLGIILKIPLVKEGVFLITHRISLVYFRRHKSDYQNSSVFKWRSTQLNSGLHLVGKSHLPLTPPLNLRPNGRRFITFNTNQWFSTLGAGRRPRRIWTVFRAITLIPFTDSAIWIRTEKYVLEQISGFLKGTSGAFIPTPSTLLRPAAPTSRLPPQNQLLTRG